MPDLKLLLEVQSLDGKRRALKLELKQKQLSAELIKLRREIKEGRAVFEKLKEIHSGIKKDIKTKEMNATEAREQADRLGQKLYSGAITNVKEINISSKKFESLKDIVNQIEDEIIDLMEKEGNITNQLVDRSTVFSKKAEQYRKIQAVYQAKQQQVKIELEKLPAIMQKLIDQLDLSLWNKYQDMKKNLNEPLARVVKGTCMGCRMGLSYSELRLLKQGEGLVYCGNCGRILYWEK